MHLPEVDGIRITSIVDGTVDPLLRDEGPASRRPRPQRSSERCLRAEHGLALLVESRRRGATFALMFDFGATPSVFLHNLDLLAQDYGFDLGAVSTMVLSHGHWDHFGGLPELLREKRASLPDRLQLHVGEGAFLARRKVAPDLPVRDMGRLDRAAIAASNVGIVEVRQPALLADQALLSGRIPRRARHEVNSPTLRVECDGGECHDDLPGEQSIAYHLAGRGLVVLTGCGHAGVINTLSHAREITGVERVHAIVGGLHTSGAPADTIARTVDDLLSFDPDYVVPMHCTGIDAIAMLRQRAPEKVVLNSVGTRYEFSSLTRQ